jgi:hypothetical protein
MRKNLKTEKQTSGKTEREIQEAERPGGLKIGEVSRLLNTAKMYSK